MLMNELLIIPHFHILETIGAEKHSRSGAHVLQI